MDVQWVDPLKPDMSRWNLFLTFYSFKQLPDPKIVFFQSFQSFQFILKRWLCWTFTKNFHNIHQSWLLSVWNTVRLYSSLLWQVLTNWTMMYFEAEGYTEVVQLAELNVTPLPLTQTHIYPASTFPRVKSTAGQIFVWVWSRHPVRESSMTLVLEFVAAIWGLKIFNKLRDSESHLGTNSTKLTPSEIPQYI